MAPYFETVKSFADVPLTDAGLDTKQFLEASDGLVNMFDLLGIGVFSFVQADIRSNIHGVRMTHASRADSCHTLEQLVQSEAHESTKHATGCLRRLLRGLLFTCRSLQYSRESEQEELRASFQRAYDAVLKHHHNFAIRKIVSIALKATPRRKDFYDRIAQGGSQEKLNEELTRWLAGLDIILAHMITFYDQCGHGQI